MSTDKKTVITVKKLNGSAAIEKSIKSIAKRSQKLLVDIHTTAVSILCHIEQHREVSLANKLANQLVNAVNKKHQNDLRQWFETYSQSTYNKETKQLDFDKAKAANEVEGTQNPFYAMNPEKEYQGMDLLKSIQNLIDLAERKQAKKNAADKIPAEKLKALKALVA